ncbi:hypothetical protein, partial [uncultured Duncaniella sp.]|uniref:hypothetical protein n=1 Tax=uncultured Duncaniella sp. TaxID=2768039 RepID=UPI0025B0E37B
FFSTGDIGNVVYHYLPAIARLMSVSEITVKKRKARLIEKLRRMLGRDIDSYLIFFLLAA